MARPSLARPAPDPKAGPRYRPASGKPRPGPKLAIALRLTSTDLPAVLDPFRLHFIMQGRHGPVRCHVFRETVDELKESHARNGTEMLRRFAVHRRRLERVADRMYGAGHATPWINVEDLLLGVSSDAWNYD